MIQRKHRRLLALLLVVCLTGCARQEQVADNPFYPENDILTVEDMRGDRMMIVIDTQYNVSTNNISQVVEAQFPEVKVLLRLQNTADSSYYTQQVLQHDQLGDIFFCSVELEKNEALMEQYFLELSNAPFIQNYFQNALNNVSVNGKIYMLPGFSDIYGIVYDRTLFAQHGWELPHSQEEFIALCQQIRAEMGYQPFMPTLKYGRMAMMLSHAFAYQDTIAGLDNQQWLQAYRQGETSFTGHMEPMFQTMKKLFDAGVLSPDCFTVDPGVRSNMLYSEYTTAMTMESQSAAIYAHNADSQHTYGMLPFYSGNTADSDYLVSATGFNILANKKLDAPENAEKRAKVMEILAYFSTPEGQAALLPPGSSAISNVHGAALQSDGAFMEGVADTLAKGNLFPEVRYTELPNNNPFQVAFREALRGYIQGEMELAEALAHCDAAMAQLQTAQAPETQVYGTAAENFTVLETAAFVADLLRKEAQAEIALVLARQLSYGEAGNFFAGDITAQSLRLVSLDYVTGKEERYNRLATVELTGAQVWAILNYPNLRIAANDTRTMWMYDQNPTYWVPSNLRVEYAPLLRENSLQSVTWMDGSPFDLEKTYTVAIWNGCFSNFPQDGYFDAATLAAMEHATLLSSKTSTELIQEALREAGTITPPKDGRLRLRWDLLPEQWQ